jgi:HAD superfamily hydrolase (TIGR01509 family)
MYKGFIFDFDGLLIDTETPEFIAWQEVYSDYGYVFPDDLWYKTIGSNQDAFEPVQHLLSLKSNEVTGENIRQQHQQKFQKRLEDALPLEGVIDLLRFANSHAIKCAVASSANKKWVTSHLQKTNLLTYFAVICTQEDVKRVKPSPDLYLLAMQNLCIHPSEAVAFEDSPNGVTAAKAAGLYCVAVPNPTTRILSFHHADEVLPTLCEFIDNLKFNH